MAHALLEINGRGIFRDYEGSVDELVSQLDAECTTKLGGHRPWEIREELEAILASDGPVYRPSGGGRPDTFTFAVSSRPFGIGSNPRGQLRNVYTVFVS